MFFSKPASINPKINVYKNYTLVEKIPVENNNHFSDMFHYFLNTDCKKEEILKAKENISLIEEISKYS